MIGRIVEFIERFALLFTGLAASAALYPLVVWSNAGDDAIPLVEPVAALIAGAPAIVFTIAHLYRQTVRGQERERRYLELNVALQKNEAMLERLAMTDALTGLYNRRYFYERLSAEIGRTGRYQRPLALVMLDLDRFKAINDEHGHQFGDFVLAEMGRLLRESLRESDVIARYGGEEFVALLPETNLGQAVAVAEKLRAAVAKHEFREGGVAVRMTISGGVAALPAPGIDGEETFVSQADKALYEAKRRGRDRVVRAPSAKPTAAEG